MVGELDERGVLTFTLCMRALRDVVCRGLPCGQQRSTFVKRRERTARVVGGVERVECCMTGKSRTDCSPCRSETRRISRSVFPNVWSASWSVRQLLVRVETRHGFDERKQARDCRYQDSPKPATTKCHGGAEAVLSCGQCTSTGHHAMAGKEQRGADSGAGQV